MKHFYKLFLLSAVFAFTTANAQTTITEWNFDAENTTPSLGTGTLTLVGGTTNTYANGNPSTGKAFNSATYPAQSTASGTAGVEIAVSTVGQTNIGLTFDHRSSGTGSRWAQYEYSTDGGTNWIVKGNNGGVLSPHDTFNFIQVDLTACTACNNNANFKFRVVSIFSPVAFNTQGSSEVFGANSAYHRSRVDGTNTSAYSSGGTWRFDNIKVVGSFVLNNEDFVLTNKLKMYPNPIENGQVLHFEETMSGTIFDINGRSLEIFNNVSELNINNYNSGIYFIKTDDNFINKLIVE